jgi:signal transduction histidine kinase
VPLTNPKNEIDRILVVEKNITKQKRAEEDVQKALVKEKELNELKSRFVSMASHEFRTPLSTVLSSVSLAEKYTQLNNREKSSKHFNRIKSSVSNLTNILNDFLSLDKLETGKIQCQPEFFDVVDLISDTTEELSDILKKGQAISYEHDGKVENIFSDPKLIKNILINLISNASKYSEEDKQIYVKTRLSDDLLMISVKDEGVGISKEDQKSLFERFFRSQNVAHIQGTGLGLNIIKRYIDLLNGEISFTSKEKVGSTFVVKIPTEYEKNTGN